MSRRPHSARRPRTPAPARPARWALCALGCLLVAIGCADAGLVPRVANANAASAPTPLAARASWTEAGIALRGRVDFEPNRARLQAESLALLDEVVALLDERPATRVEVQAHLDAAWVCQHCARRLTRDRAAAVVDYLVARGVARDRLAFQGYEGTRPLRDCSAERGRRRVRACRRDNSRVEFRLLPPAS